VVKLVKGISRQVIVVQSPDPKLFDQAIFILRDEAVAQGVTEDALLKEAQQAVGIPARLGMKDPALFYSSVWAFAGAAVMGLLWLISSFF
jgi:hypothetical protein